MGARHFDSNWISQWVDSVAEDEDEVHVSPTPPKTPLGLHVDKTPDREVDPVFRQKVDRDISGRFLFRKYGVPNPPLKIVSDEDLWAMIVEDTPDRVKLKNEEEELLKRAEEHEDHERSRKRKLELDHIALFSEEEQALEDDRKFVELIYV